MSSSGAGNGRAGGGRWEGSQTPPGALSEADRSPLSVAPFRVGSVPYLNAAPLTYGLEREVRFVVPAKLAELLRAQQLDAALVSVAEVLHHDHYEVLDGVAIASTGAVYSVHLAHRRPLEELSEIYCDPASLTGANLLRVLLAEWNLRLSLRPLPDYRLAAECDAVLLIGDEAIDFQLGGHPHHILDLGTAWHQLTGLPFVYAVWALRRGLDHACLRQTLRRARDLGLGALEEIIRTHPAYTVDFRRQYFRRHVQYQLGPSEKRGIGKFIELLRRHDLGPVYEPRYAD